MCVCEREREKERDSLRERVCMYEYIFGLLLHTSASGVTRLATLIPDATFPPPSQYQLRYGTARKQKIDNFHLLLIYGRPVNQTES
jgi:hypothetical protein